MTRTIELLCTLGPASMNEHVIRRMDELGVDVHILYPTIFLRPLTRRPEAEVAMCRSYNRWLADIWRQGGGRLRWVVVPPVMSLDKAVRSSTLARSMGLAAFSCAVALETGG